MAAAFYNEDRLRYAMSMEVAAYCDFCGKPQSFETLVDHQNACMTDAQARAAAAFVTRHGVSDPISGAADHTLPASAAALPIVAISRVFCDIKSSVGCPRACEILPNLWLGSADVAHNTTWLQQHGIHTVVNAAKDARPLAQDVLAAAGVRRLVHLPLHDDSEAERLAQRGNYALLRAGAAAIAEAFGLKEQMSSAAVAAIASLELTETGALPQSACQVDSAGVACTSGGVFVHCAFGRSRSAAVVVMYLILYRGLSLLAALVLLRARRPITLPNEAFTAALIASEEVAAASSSKVSSVPEDLQLTQYALIREFNMQTGARLPSGSTGAHWNTALAIARSLAAAYDSDAPFASLPATFVPPTVWSAR
jgi:hypothetical protein